MSISKFQEGAQKSGCIKVVLFVSAAVMFAGMFYAGCSTRNNPQAKDAGERVAFQIGDVAVSQRQLDDAVAKGDENLKRQSSVTLQMESSVVRQAIAAVVDQAYALVAVRKANVKVDDKSLLDAFDATIEDEKMMLRFQLSSQKLMPADGTDAQFDEAFKKLQGQTFTQMIQKARDQFKKSIDTDAGRGSATMGLANQLLSGSILNQVKITDDDVKSSFDELTLKRVYLGPTDADGARALGDLKSGSSFEAIMDRYSKSPSQGGKKPSDETTTFPKSQFMLDPSFAPVIKLKAGENTGVIKVSDGYAIYKLISAKPNVPKDFEAKKADYVKDFKRRSADPLIRQAIDAAKKTPVKWEMKGYKALYDLDSSLVKPAEKAEDRKKALETILAEANAVIAERTPDFRAAIFAAYGAADALYGQATDKVAAGKAVATAIEQYLESAESGADRLRLIDLYIEAKDGDKAANQVVKAIQTNGLFDKAGEQLFQEASGKAAILKSKGLLSPEMDKAIKAEQVKWRELKDREDKAQEEVRKAQEEERKKADAEMKKAIEDAKKKEAEKAAQTGAKSDAGKPTTPNQPAKTDKK